MSAGVPCLMSDLATGYFDTMWHCASCRNSVPVSRVDALVAKLPARYVSETQRMNTAFAIMHAKAKMAPTPETEKSEP